MTSHNLSGEAIVGPWNYTDSCPKAHASAEEHNDGLMLWARNTDE